MSFEVNSDNGARRLGHKKAPYVTCDEIVSARRSLQVLDHLAPHSQPAKEAKEEDEE